ncbi:hypothetical protein [Kitasatospora purpeofusca]|uniref:hypothetical protein n=1 Tax=Kitasatospora purpeofusca TaxID=67352 RepID=UPI00381235BE
MAQTRPSKEDTWLLQELGGLLTFDQLRRLRGDGAIPGNLRRGLGQGAGSTSRTHPDTPAIAAALGAALTAGRPRPEAVLDVFATQPEVPLPGRGVKNALRWHINRIHSSGLHARIEKAIASADGEDALARAAVAAHDAPEIRRRLQRAPVGTDVKRYREALVICAIAEVLGVGEAGEDAWAEAQAYRLGVEHRDRATSDGTGLNVADATAAMARTSLQLQLLGEPGAEPKTVAERRYEELARVDRCAIEEIRRLRDSIILVSSIEQITHLLPRVDPHAALLDEFEEFLLSEGAVITSVHDLPVALEMGLTASRWRLMADWIVWGCDPRGAYSLNQTVDLISEWLCANGDRLIAAARLPSPESDRISGLVRELEGARGRLHAASPHVQKARTHVGDIGCAFTLLSVLRHQDERPSGDDLDAAVRATTGHLADQLGSNLGMVEVMRGLQSICKVLPFPAGTLSDSTFLLDAWRRLIRIYRVPADLVPGAIKTLSSISHDTTYSNRLPISAEALYAWARTVQYVADQADHTAGDSGAALRLARERLGPFPEQ